VSLLSKKAPTLLQKACRKCKTIVSDDVAVCPNCGSTDFSDDWSGLIVIVDPNTSKIAQMLNISKPGHYAIKVR